MKTSYKYLAAVVACAAALTGCDWGGTSSDEAWNDNYAWANFTGVYKLTQQIVGGTSSDSSSTESGSSTSSSKTVSLKYDLSGKLGDDIILPSSYVALQDFNLKTISGKVLGPTGSTLDTFEASHESSDTASVVSKKDRYNVSINWAAGKVIVTAAAPDSAASQKSVSITFGFSYTSVTGQAPVVTPDAGEEATTTTKPISWLNVVQKGNLLTMTDNHGVVYSGRYTGASCPGADENGYMTAGHIRFSFEVSSANASIAGALSGDWSGASSATTGRISNRTIDATYTAKGQKPVAFQAFSGDVIVETQIISQASAAVSAP